MKLLHGYTPILLAFRFIALLPKSEAQRNENLRQDQPLIAYRL